jgi:hypothetical protein
VDFETPDADWPETDQTNYKLDYDAGNYRVQLKQEQKAVYVWPEHPFKDPVIEVEAWRSTGGGSNYGIVFGLDCTGGPGRYLFTVQPGNRNYSLHRRDSGSWVTLIDWARSSYINPDHGRNTLRVVRDGGQTCLWVNGHHLVTHFDSTYVGHRCAGVMAGSSNVAPVWLRFDDFTVWTTSTSGERELVLGSNDSSAPWVVELTDLSAGDIEP